MQDYAVPLNVMTDSVTQTLALGDIDLVNIGQQRAIYKIVGGYLYVAIFVLYFEIKRL